MRREMAALLMVMMAGAGLGCSPACDTGDDVNTPTVYEEGAAVNGYYFSTSSHGELLHFPGGKRYDLYHHLGFEPIMVQLYWSFNDGGVGTYDQTKDKSSLTTAAGNSAVIQLKNDQFIRVKNDSCVEYWMLAVASGDPRVMDAGPGGDEADAASE
jgi:hypothetical protein